VVSKASDASGKRARDPVRVRFPARVTPEMHAELRAISYLLGVSLNEIVVFALKRWLQDAYRERPNLRDAVNRLIVRSDEA